MFLSSNSPRSCANLLVPPSSVTIRWVSKMASKGQKHARSESTDDPALKHPSPKRAKEIDADPPFEKLEALLEKNNADIKPKCVLHWFRSKDIRQEDNKGLHAASQKAKEGSGSLLTMYLHSPKDLEWHGTSPARTDFVLQSLSILQQQLQAKDIPLAIVEAEERSEKKEKVLQFIKDHDVSHVYANMEYEVDELRRDIGIAKALQAENVSFEVLHDQTAVPPKVIAGSSGPMKVFTPYHKAWLSETKSEPSWFETVPAPEGNDKKAAQEFKKLFETKVPSLPESKNQFESTQERDRLRKLWPAGHDAGMDRLSKFLDNKVGCACRACSSNVIAKNFRCPSTRKIASSQLRMCPAVCPHISPPVSSAFARSCRRHGSGTAARTSTKAMLVSIAGCERSCSGSSIVT